MLEMCDRFGCLPSQLYAEDSDLLRLLLIEKLGRPVKSPEGGGQQ